MNIRKIIKEEMDELDWAKQTIADAPSGTAIPTVYAVYYGSSYPGSADDLEGYFTKDAFERYLIERNQEREEMGEEPEEVGEFIFKRININW